MSVTAAEWRLDFWALLLRFGSRVWVSSRQLVSVNLRAAHRVENAVLQSLVVLLKLAEQILHIFSFRSVILGAQRGHNRHRASSDEVLHVLFRGVEQGTDERQLSV